MHAGNFPPKPGQTVSDYVRRVRTQVIGLWGIANSVWNGPIDKDGNIVYVIRYLDIYM